MGFLREFLWIHLFIFNHCTFVGVVKKNSKTCRILRALMWLLRALILLPVLYCIYGYWTSIAANDSTMTAGSQKHDDILFSCHHWYWPAFYKVPQQCVCVLTELFVNCLATLPCCKHQENTSLICQFPTSRVSMTHSEGVTWPPFQRHSRRWEMQAGLTRVPLTGPRGNVKVWHISSLLFKHLLSNITVLIIRKPLPCNHAMQRTLHSAERACVLCRRPRRGAFGSFACLLCTCYTADRLIWWNIQVSLRLCGPGEDGVDDEYKSCGKKPIIFCRPFGN